MAWQLIYTSAPRSLEAGRSGFGTVARHRAISPLLASAIERTSQFSRLHGVDAGRVIFSYRIVVAAGGRFHVLSSIRDAGADYTGRTNHIAHHLVAEAREIARLGADGPSPADVLLATKWAASWTEPPRYFETAEEIALAAIRPQPNRAAWRQITGMPDQAWLLASGDAARGAYLIQPAGIDLREVFAESLRLIPERLWQISFTTSLQPSDEPADFRWIGIEERSPLRAQIESSGRPVLNLGAPGTLPLIEAALPAMARQIQQTSGPVHESFLIDGRTASLEAASATAPHRPVGTTWEQEPETQSVPEADCRPSHPKFWLLGVTLVLIASAAFFAGHPAYVRYEHRKAVQGEIDSILGRSGGFFSNTVNSSLKSADIVDIAKEIAQAADRSWQIAYHADFPAMLRLPDEAVREHAKLANLNTPEEILALDDRLANIAKIHQQLADFPKQPEDYNALERLQKLRSEAGALTASAANPNTFDKIKSALDRLTGRQRAQIVQTLLTGASDGRVQPAEPPAWFEKALADPRFASDDEEANLIVKAAGQIIDGWKFIDGQESGKTPAGLERHLKQQTAWPQWLLAKAESKTKTGGDGKAASGGKMHADSIAPRPLLYFVQDNNNLSIVLTEDRKPRFFLKLPGKDESELKPFNGNIQLGIGDFGAIFKVQGNKLLPGSTPPKPPYELSVRNADSVEIVRVYVGASADRGPLFANLSFGLTMEGHILRLTGDIPRISSALNPSFWLLTSGAFDGSGVVRHLPVTAAGECDLQTLIGDVRKRVSDKRALADRLSKQAGEQGADVKTIDSLRKKAKEYAAILKREDSRKIFNAEEKTGSELVGDFAKALAEEWSNEKDDSFEPLREAGRSLGEAFANSANALAKCKALLNEVQKLDQTNRTAEKADGLSKLRSLCNSLQASLGDTTAAEKEAAQFRSAAEAAEREAKALETQPLLSGKLPPGEYVWMLKTKNMNDVRLSTFTVKP